MQSTEHRNCSHKPLAALVIVLTLNFCLSKTARAASENDASSSEVTQKIKLLLHCSRPQIDAGSAFGISADVTNTTDTTIYFNPVAFVLIPPRSRSGCAGWVACDHPLDSVNPVTRLSRSNRLYNYSLATVRRHSGQVTNGMVSGSYFNGNGKI